MSISKSDLISNVAAATNLPRCHVEAVISTALDCISTALAEKDIVTLTGFGTFAPKLRQERKGRNPRTGESVSIPATWVPTFKPGKPLKDAVAGSTTSA